MNIPRGSYLPSKSQPWMMQDYNQYVAGNPAFDKYPQSQEPAETPEVDWDEQPTRPLYNTIVNNVYYRSGASSFDIRLDPKTARDVHATWQVNGNVIYGEGADLGFVDEFNYNYELQPDSVRFLGPRSRRRSMVRKTYQ